MELRPHPDLNSSRHMSDATRKSITGSSGLALQQPRKALHVTLVLDEERQPSFRTKGSITAARRIYADVDGRGRCRAVPIVRAIRSPGLWNMPGMRNEMGRGAPARDLAAHALRLDAKRFRLPHRDVSESCSDRCALPCVRRRRRRGRSRCRARRVRGVGVAERGRLVGLPLRTICRQ